MNKLRWGLLGTARIDQALLPPLRASARNELTAVASRDLERAKAYSTERDIPRVFGSYEAVLADPDVDVIYNPLLNSLHTEWTIRAVQAGKHVLCEKPLALTVEEVDAIAAAARAAMEENGIEFIGPIERDTDDYKWTHFRAPNEFVYELTCSPALPSNRK